MYSPATVYHLTLIPVSKSKWVREDCTVPKYHAAVNYTLRFRAPHGTDRGAWPIAALTDSSQ